MLTINNQYLYDHKGRKLKTWEQIQNGTKQPDARTLLSDIDYNEVNQQLTKALHSTDSVNFLQYVGYVYNERGWLTNTNSLLFGLELHYNTGANPQYNGNINSQLWGSFFNLNNRFNYTYDRLNRLTSGATTNGKYIERGISYDKAGNIASLSRVFNSTRIDSLSLIYNNTNQLQGVWDKSADTSHVGYKAGNWGYTYDGNGNMVNDSSKAISTTYNLLNLPQSIAALNTTYTYDANGRKLRRVVGTDATDYIDGIQYEGTAGAETIKFIQTEEGRALPVDTVHYNYEYNLSDHLGNNRITFDTYTHIYRKVQQDDYMPFGMDISTPPVNSPQNFYLYNNKELQGNTQLYDYGARFYDPVIARWLVVDAYAEKSKRWSPYNYGENNPLKNIDIAGDTIIEVGKGIQNDATYHEGVSTMRRTYMGKAEYDKYYGSSSTFVYVSHGEGTTEGAGSLANLRDHDEVTSDNHVATDDPVMSNFNGMSVKKGVQVDLIEVNTTQEARLDKYDMAMAIFHEMRAHLDNNKGNGDSQHNKFGNANLSPGLFLYDQTSGRRLYRPGSDAYTFLRQLLTIKIKDGKGTDQNKADLQEMVKYMQQEAKEKKAKKH